MASDSTTSAAAERQRRRRERKRAGVVVLQVPVAFIELTELLVEKGLLDPMECEDRGAAAGALATLLADLVTEDGHA